MSVGAGACADGLGASGACRTGATEQAPRVPTIAATHKPAHGGRRVKKRGACMGLILLEALLALVILVAIVWWTMFSGRNKGELPDAQAKDQPPPSDGPKG